MENKELCIYSNKEYEIYYIYVVDYDIKKRLNIPAFVFDANFLPLAISIIVAKSSCASTTRKEEK